MSGETEINHFETHFSIEVFFDKLNNFIDISIKVLLKIY